MNIPSGGGVCVTLLMHFMVHYTTDMAHLVGGRTHTAHIIPSGKLCPGSVPGAGHSALTQHTITPHMCTWTDNFVSTVAHPIR